ncbi:hypothetical protein P691DRAFT_699774 [Macrolepiota fuliginosa MF-IS2]|uniref:Metallo-beta-lactamase domain-containing protein n=1 Tax=Macrolepiota fuliginosa MF-IS2 TaxID=1400762 RepID=A0A9P5XHW9_9AGAR|nr:hypothetical protein P691DRAFT_699774 [Macrolepiota fuliginosa MF-IS2]
MTSAAMVYPMGVTFLGTSSGGGPTENRNCSSLLCDFFEGSDLWMVDCAEGTSRQFALQPQRPGMPRVRIPQVTKLFVTHMHPDHIMGIPTLLRNLLRAPPVDAPPARSNAIAQRKTVTGNQSLPIIEIYGPCGLRSFIRQNLKMTFTRCDDTYVVHELLRKGDPIVPCNAPPDEFDPTSGSNFKDWDILHCNELPGSDFHADGQGLWYNIASRTYSRRAAQISVNAGSILHREPCIGYVFEEMTSPRRKVVILGDTYDPSSIIPLCSDPSPTLLVHEATDSILSPDTDNNGRLSKRSLTSVMKTTLARGHSTPVMAGEFAKRVNAQKLVLNHIGSRFPAPRINDTLGRGFAHRVLDDLEDQATKAWNTPSGEEAIVALDFMRVLVPEPRGVNDDSTPLTLTSASASTSTTSLPAPPSSLPQKPPPMAPLPNPVMVGTPSNHNNDNYLATSPSWDNGGGDLGVHNITNGFPGPGQAGYYGHPMGYDPIQMAQFYTFAQMMHLGVGAGTTGIVGGIGAGMGTEMGMGFGTGMEMGPMGGGIGLGGMVPIPMFATATGAAAVATPMGMLTVGGGAVAMPRAQAPAGGMRGLEELERDPVIARSIAAANTQYENSLSSGEDGPEEKGARKLRQA